mgnify:CR=1 FL=1
MCWNANISLNTFIFGFFATTFGWYNNLFELPSWLLYQSFLLMQLIEYFVWSKTLSNSVLSQFAFLVILLQPILSMLRIGSTTNFQSTYLPRKRLLFVKYVLLTIYLLTTVFYFATHDHIQYSMTPSKNGHLSWNWFPEEKGYMFSWVFFLIFPSILCGKYNEASYMFSTFLITFLLFSNTKTWGSLWCWSFWFAGLYWLIKVFLKDICI